MIENANMNKLFFMIKKSQIIFLIMILSSFILNAQTSVQWINNPSSSGNENGNSVFTDANGNIYVTGFFDSPTISLGTTTLTNNGSSDVFITKYDSTGNVVWMKSAGGTDRDYANKICTDASGNVYIIGNFLSSSISFGNITLTNDSTGLCNVFIVKYDAAGNVVWAKSAGGSKWDNGNGITVDALGNVIICGYFNSPTMSFGNTSITTNGIEDIFVAKYNSNGNLLWANNYGGIANDYGTGIACDNAGNIYFCGYFSSPTLAFGSSTLNNNGSDDIFLTKFDSNGNVVWSQNAVGSAGEVSNGIALDGNGNVYLCGTYTSPSLSFGNISINNNGNKDIFLVKYNSSGNAIWANTIGGSGEEYGNGISVDNSGNIYLIGIMGIGSFNVGSSSLSNIKNGFSDVFYAKYNFSGNPIWANNTGGTKDNIGIGICSDNIGNAIITGYFDSPIILINNSNYSNHGGEDIFVIKINN
jgi:hypothetical protein